jgi:hypothetical protein
MRWHLFEAWEAFAQASLTVRRLGSPCLRTLTVRRAKGELEDGKDHVMLARPTTKRLF